MLNNKKYRVRQVDFNKFHIITPTNNTVYKFPESFIPLVSFTFCDAQEIADSYNREWKPQPEN
jgi:hypothetical protein